MFSKLKDLFTKRGGGEPAREAPGDTSPATPPATAETPPAPAPETPPGQPEPPTTPESPPAGDAPRTDTPPA